MYRLLIVDDEETEREGMAQFIAWEDYGIELAGTAWNGVEGYQMICRCSPDIVITDIKMPVMNGIELIQKTRKEFPDIEFIVLSGYGEYEFTSQAMEEGVRHYVLKPCVEAKIIEAVEKVKASIEERRQQKNELAAYNHTIRKILPRAKEQVFYNLLMGREQIQEDYQLFMEELDAQSLRVRVLALRFGHEIDYLGQFILENILGELLGSHTLILSATYSNESVYLLQMTDTRKVRTVVKRVASELGRGMDQIIYAALSEEGLMHDIRALYLQTDELFHMGGNHHAGELLSYEFFREQKGEMDALVSYDQLKNVSGLDGLLAELYFVFCKMQINGYTFEQKKESCRWIQKILCKGEASPSVMEAEEDTKLFRETALFLIKKTARVEEKSREEKVMDKILMAVYEHLAETRMSIRYLSQEVVFLNEDYFSRVFRRHQNMKFSAYVQEARIAIAKRILQYRPDMKLSETARLTGFPEDGQYFSKAFRKTVGMTPSEYRETLPVQKKQQNP